VISIDDLTEEELSHLLDDPDVASLLQDPGRTRAAFDVVRAEESLTAYAGHIWPILEPVVPFIRGWAVDGVAEHLEAVTAGHINKLLMNVPPGFGKSNWTDVIWPSWEWGPKNRPWTKFVSASYGQHLTERNNDRFRSIINSDIYKAGWGDRFQLEKDNTVKVTNDKTGFKFATSVTGVGTGERGHRVVIDDPHNVKMAESDVVRQGAVTWLTETMPTRLIPIPAGYEGKIPQATVMIMQRVHELDCSGHLLSFANALGYEVFIVEMEFDPSHPYARKRRSRIGWRDPRADRYEASLAAWEVLRTRREQVVEEVERVESGLLAPDGDEYAAALRVLGTIEMPPEPAKPEGGELAFPELHTPEAVESLKETLRSSGGQYAEAGQLQQQPVSRKGGMFTKEAIVIRPAHLCPPPRGLIRGWDFAGSKTSRSPYTAGALLSIQRGVTYVWDMIRRRVEAAELEDFFVQMARLDGQGVVQDIPQDPGQAGKAQVASMKRRLQGYLVYSSVETGAKDDRAKPLSAQAESGNLVFVEGPWNKVCLDEIGVFPASKFKDQVDGMSRGYARACKAKEEAPPAGGYTPGMPGTHPLPPLPEY
jgi:predicted phage terminase large subunit-like protein